MSRIELPQNYDKENITNRLSFPAATLSFWNVTTALLWQEILSHLFERGSKEKCRSGFSDLLLLNRCQLDSDDKHLFFEKF